ncbi:hypothetical protein ACRJ4B_03760 [Streptomyces sp. GTA36]
MQAGDGHRTDAEIDRNVDLRPGGALEAQPGGGRPHQREVDVQFDRAGGQNRAEEPVRVGEVQDDLAALDGCFHHEFAVRTLLGGVPFEVGACCRAQQPRLDPRAAGRAQHEDRRSPGGVRGLETEPHAAPDFGRRRDDPQIIGGRQQFDRGLLRQGRVGRHGERHGVADRQYQVQSLGGRQTQQSLDAGHRVVGGPDVDRRDAQERRWPGLHEGEVRDRAEEDRQPAQQQIPVELGRAPAIELREDVDGVVEQRVQPVEPQDAAYVRGRRRRRGLGSRLKDTEQFQ